MLKPNEIVHFYEVHDPISARVASQTGFDFGWVSSLCVATSHGIRDSEELGPEHILDTCLQLSSTSNLKLLVDGTNGFNSIEKLAYLIKRLEKIGALGIVIEDKAGVKNNSLQTGAQIGATEGDFIEKIQASLALRSRMLIVARLEGLIRGESADAVYRRARAAHEVGADAIFIHSNRDCFDHIQEVCHSISGEIPVIVCPTTYPLPPSNLLLEHAIRGVIWANQGMRAAIRAQLEVAEHIRKYSSAPEEGLMSMKELFQFMDYEEISSLKSRFPRI